VVADEAGFARTAWFGTICVRGECDTAKGLAAAAQ